MKIKISQELIRMLRLASGRYDFNYSEIAKKALRKYNHLRPSLDMESVPSTYKGETYRFSISTTYKPDHVRAVLHWYLNGVLSKPHPKPFIPDPNEKYTTFSL